ncbi:MAG: hypothetical protein CMB64_04120 [Euryarchaeota archaeon]|nr:hypothetical protein [Euryarchaeota archaeon]
MLLYHYTHITTALDKINEDAILKVQNESQDNALKPALWFSANKKFETSALKGFINQETGKFSQFKTFEDQLTTIGCVRYVAETNTVPFLNWKDYTHVSGIDLSDIKKMEKIHKDLGADTSEWYCSFEDLHFDKLLRAEVYTNDWVELNEKNLIDAINKAKWLNE